MSPKAQRIAIAQATHPELAKWPIEWSYTQNDDYEKDYVWVERVDQYRVHAHQLPDYLGDLNACHVMEESLTKEQLSEYGSQLNRMSSNPVSFQCPEPREIAITAMATTAQRCEAFLRTLNLWDDTK